MYAKVFTQIYDGTLCTKGPWQALVTFQQMLVLADQEGNVDMTASAISRRTTIPLEIIELGIESLIQEDKDSRTPDEGGRRLVPLAAGRSWGWRIVNYKHYRAMKREEDRREYHREYWHKRKSSNTTQAQHAQPIAEAEAEADGKEDPPNPPKGGYVDTPGFAEFWAAWPSSPRKVGRKQAAAKWKRNAFASKLPVILAHVEAMKRTKQWQDGFEPAPLTYLNQERWGDGVPDEQDCDMSELRQMFSRSE